MTKSPLYETTAWSKVILPMRRQFRKVRRSRKNGPCVSPSSVTSMSKGERALRPGVTAVVDLRHDLVAEVQSRALDSGLAWRHRETHEGRRARGLALPLPGPPIVGGRANARFLAPPPKPTPDDQKGRLANAPPQRRRVRSVEQFDVVDVVVMVAADILLSHETGGAQRRDVIGVDGREQLADHRQRAEIAAPRLAAAGRIAPPDPPPPT